MIIAPEFPDLTSCLSPIKQKIKDKNLRYLHFFLTATVILHVTTCMYIVTCRVLLRNVSKLS